MRAIQYAFREACRSLWRRRASSIVAVLAIGLALVVLGALLLVTSNAERILAGWANAAEVSIFLGDAVTADERRAVESAVDASPASAGREFVSKADALARFRGDFPSLAPLAADNPFPSSVEVLVTPDAQGSPAVDALIEAVAGLPGVVDVRYDREWIARALAVLDAVRRLGFVLALVMMAVAAVSVGAVVRLALHDRRDEIEVMSLVGSPDAFIRGPFVAEGLLQGGAGAIVALLALRAGFALVLASWGDSLAAAGVGEAVQFLPWSLSGLLVAGGLAVGCLGGLGAVVRVS
ncbi:MAG: FtsX-like permease family protein [Acidimicrobiia bacterium]|nr:FtsX-like permease family protein [Acidimicrobiia bacterium]